MRAVIARWGPGSLFARLALLLCVAVLSSHVLALTLLFEMGPPPPPPPSAGPLPPGAPHGPGPWHAGLWLDIGVRLGVLMLAAWVGARWLSRPMRELARAARELGDDIDRPALPEFGPRECREATRVFNQMQARIRQQRGDRDRFVAAVSHDLRTPLTRLRLRAESLAPQTQRQGFRRDIAEMDDMIRLTLDYLCGGARTEATVPVDPQALVAALVEDQRACGHRVTWAGQAAPVPAQALALRRCLGNLVDNAVRYGGQAHVTLHDAGHRLSIEVQDAGPGLPEAELTRVLAPFYRLEASRNRHHGGVGLGLSIAHDIARRHGGELTLHNAPGGGLLARLTLSRGMSVSP